MEAENLPFEVGGVTYQATKMNVWDQLAIGRRLTPALKAIFTPDIFGTALAAAKEGEGLNFSAVDLGKFIPAMADAFYSLTDDDLQRIIRTCCKVVQRQGTSGVWSGIMNAQGGLQYEDIELLQLLQISWKVIEAKLGSFFSIAR